jgi:hypothetical protein
MTFCTGMVMFITRTCLNRERGKCSHTGQYNKKALFTNLPHENDAAPAMEPLIIYPGEIYSPGHVLETVAERRV